MANDDDDNVVKDFLDVLLRAVEPTECDIENVTSIFQSIDNRLNDLYKMPKILAGMKASIISDISRQAYNAALKTGIVNTMLEDINLDKVEEKDPIQAAFFHLGLQCGMDFQLAQDRLGMKVKDSLEAAAEKRESAGARSFDDAPLVRITVDQNNGFVQLFANGEVITCEHARKIEIINV